MSDRQLPVGTEEDVELVESLCSRRDARSTEEGPLEVVHFLLDRQKAGWLWQSETAKALPQEIHSRLDPHAIPLAVHEGTVHVLLSCALIETAVRQAFSALCPSYKVKMYVAANPDEFETFCRNPGRVQAEPASRPPQVRTTGEELMM
jgi:hypothetical protein